MGGTEAFKIKVAEDHAKMKSAYNMGAMGAMGMGMGGMAPMGMGRGAGAPGGGFQASYSTFGKYNQQGAGGVGAVRTDRAGGNRYVTK